MGRFDFRMSRGSTSRGNIADTKASASSVSFSKQTSIMEKAIWAGALNLFKFSVQNGGFTTLTAVRIRTVSGPLGASAAAQRRRSGS
eukprot:6203060-Alexandrium_andersonii.AAC.1